MLFHISWTLLEGARALTWDTFASMDAAMDHAEEVQANINLLGRWSNIAAGKGHAIVEAKSSNDVFRFLARWTKHSCTCTVTPVLDDNEARRVILGTQELPYEIVYDAARQQENDQGLFWIDYRFYKDKREEGYQQFAHMTDEEARSDSGKCVPLGRWHDLATGTGCAVAIASSAVDIQQWAYKWRAVCECDITPVQVDSDARATMRGE